MDQGGGGGGFLLEEKEKEENTQQKQTTTTTTTPLQQNNKADKVRSQTIRASSRRLHHWVTVPLKPKQRMNSGKSLTVLFVREILIILFLYITKCY